MKHIKQKVIIIMGHYLPGNKVGGPLVSILNMLKNLESDYNFKIISSNRDFGENEPYPNIATNCWLDVEGYQTCYFPKNIIGFLLLLKQIKKEATPNTVVYLNSVFNFQFSGFIVFAKRFGFIRIKNVIIAPRGELFPQSLAFKTSKKLFFLKIAKLTGIYKNIQWHATNTDEKKSIIATLNINPKKIRIASMMSPVNEKIDITSLKPLNNSQDNDQLKIIYLGRIAKDKNIGFTFDVLNKVEPMVQFDIFGPIEEEDLWELCKNKISNLPPNIKVNYCGILKRELVRDTLKKYDLFFLPTFGENFGHAIAESLGVGTPVLISNKTPWRNLESKNMGWDLSLEAPEQFINAINVYAKIATTERFNNRAKIIEKFVILMNDPEILRANRDLFKLPF
jgi:glycosyltransferase involved in cell wall biosynthesis